MFDPFNDFQTVGYLRNAEAQKDPKKVRRAEHVAFMVGLEQALDQLKRRKADLTYADYLRVHKTLFQDYYPWAGIDRHDLGVGKLITKGPNVQFELSENCRKAVEWGLSMGNNAKHIRERPGEVMGAFAWGHPFLDGNGRAMLLVHSELCHRAGFAIDWIASNKADYLAALTHELAHPRDRALDAYFTDLIVDTRPRSDWAAYFKSIPGLSGLDDEEEHVGYSDDDAGAIARYEETKRQRELEDPVCG
nr:Fic family protein [uncultured Roseateles sp.]